MTGGAAGRSVLDRRVGLSVLLVEDGEADREFAKLCLAESDEEFFQVDTVGTLAAAVQRLGEHPYDVVLLDLQLPDGSGTSMVAELRRRFPTQAVIVLTGLDDVATARAALRCGAEDFVPKSDLTPERIGRCIRFVVERTAANRRFELMARFASDVMAFHDSDGRVLYASPATETVLAMQPEDLLDHFLDELAHPLDAPSVREAVRSLEHRETATVQYRLANSTETRWCETTWRCIPDVHPGERLAYVSTTRDVTDRRRLDEHLAEKQRLEAVGMLAGGVAHDFNNQLAAITGFVQIALKQVGEDDPVRRPLTQVLRAGEAAAKLTRQLLAYGRRQTLTPEPFDVSSLVSELQTMLQSLLRGGVRLQVELADEALPVMADRAQIEQALVNLVDNARDALPEGGVVALRTDTVVLTESDPRLGESGRAGTYVRLIVEDDGVGMDEAVRTRIFEPFFTTKRRDEASGLGLSSAYGVIRQSQGHLHCTSRPGRGTRFEILLPRFAAAAGNEDGEEAPEAPLIVVAEDRASVRRILRRTLEAEGYRVRQADDGAAAWELIQSLDAPPALLLTDIVMPRMSGTELTRRARRRYPDLPVILLTGFTDHDTQDVGVLREVDGLLRKPFTLHTLREQVAQVLGDRVARSS